MEAVLLNGARGGVVVPPPSKSHLHRLLIGAFLAGETAVLEDSPDDSADITATRRCLRALASDNTEPVLDCGESGSTLRFLRPVAAALGKRPQYVMRGRLASRPDKEYPSIAHGLHELPGDVSSQFATGLLFALPLLDGDSEIRFTSPLESRGYVDLTLSVLSSCGIVVDANGGGFLVKGRQTYHRPMSLEPERDWSGATFWFAMNAIGSRIEVRGLDDASAQPDRRAVVLLKQVGGEKDVSQCPDAFPALAVAAAAQDAETLFTGTRRLRLKESDRVASVASLLGFLGVDVMEESDAFTVFGRGGRFIGGFVARAFGDHRIAMSAAVAATNCNSPITVDDASCAVKSYPSFFDDFASLPLL